MTRDEYIAKIRQTWPYKVLSQNEQLSCAAMNLSVAASSFSDDPNFENLVDTTYHACTLAWLMGFDSYIDGEADAIRHGHDYTDEMGQLAIEILENICNICYNPRGDSMTTIDRVMQIAEQLGQMILKLEELSEWEFYGGPKFIRVKSFDNLRDNLKETDDE